MRLLDELRAVLRPVPVPLSEAELRVIWEHLYDEEEGSEREKAAWLAYQQASEGAAA
jgi:hypothetical protein